MSTNEAFLRRNFWVHVIEGGLYMGGLTFLSQESVLPKMVDTLGGSPRLVSYMPVLMIIGFMSPVIFVAPLINRLSRFKPVIVWIGVAQRLPYLVAAVFLWFFADDLPRWTLWIVVGTPLVSGLFGGLVVNAWLEMVTRMIPENKRAAGWAYRFIIQAAIGVVAGPVIHRILGAMPGVRGYAILHLIAFALLATSMIVFCGLREIDLPSPPPRTRRKRYWPELRSILKHASSVPVFLRFLTVRFTGVGYFVILPFLTIHALQVTGRPEADVGYFVTAQMTGSITGNLLAAAIGNRYGGKAVMILARLLLITLAIFLVFNTSYAGFVAAFFAFGVAMFADRVGDMTLGVELSPREDRPSFLALLTFIQAPAMILAAELARVIKVRFDRIEYAAIAAAIIAAISLAVLLTVHEPRRKKAQLPIA